LFGISKLDSYNHWTKQYSLNIDYRQSLDNYKTYLINHFTAKGFAIDFFLSTYNSTIENELIKDFAPKKYVLVPFKTGKSNHISRNSHYINVLNLANMHSIHNKITYDLVIVTRFDIMFKKPLDELRIYHDRFNISYRCETDPNIDDNFYIFHGKYLATFLKFISALPSHLSYHKIYNRLIQHISNINFMVDGNYWVNNNPVYDLIRNKSNDVKPIVPVADTVEKRIGNKIITITKLNPAVQQNIQMPLIQNAIDQRRISDAVIVKKIRPIGFKKIIPAKTKSTLVSTIPSRKVQPVRAGIPNTVR